MIGVQSSEDFQSRVSQCTYSGLCRCLVRVFRYGATIEEEQCRILSTRSRPAPTPPCGYVAGTDSTTISRRGGGLLYCYPPTIMRALSERCHQNQFLGYVFPERGGGWTATGTEFSTSFFFNGCNTFPFHDPKKID